jgi:transposase
MERRDDSLRQIATHLVVGLSFGNRLLRHYRTTGSLEPKPHGREQHSAAGPAQLTPYKALIRNLPDATLEELRQRPSVACSTMAISHALRKLKIARKKKIPHAQERDTPEGQQKRCEFLEEISWIDPKRPVFVDESGANSSMTRISRRAPVGERVHGAVSGHWDSVTLICGLRLSEVMAAVVFQGARDTRAFQSSIAHVVVPELRRDDVVTWSNLTPHKAPAVVAAVEQADAHVLPLPPSGPDLTPIEEMFSEVEAALRSAPARPAVAIYAAIGSALHDVSRHDILGWLRSRAAYAIQS